MGIGLKIGIDIGSKLGTPKYGQNLVTNGDFSNSGTGWQIVGSPVVDYSSGIADIQGTLSGDRIQQTLIPIENGERYLFEFNGKNITNQNQTAYVYGTGGAGTILMDSVVLNSTDWKSYSFEFTANRDECMVWLRVNQYSAMFDDISIRKIL